MGGLLGRGRGCILMVAPWLSEHGAGISYKVPPRAALQGRVGDEDEYTLVGKHISRCILVQLTCHKS